MAEPLLARRDLPVIRVLLVEDDLSDAALITGHLEQSKTALYKTHHVPTQAAAVSAISQQTFDVCLLDLTLPDASKFSALTDIQDKTPDVPVLILTSIKNMALAKRVVSHGAQDYLLKDEIQSDGLSRAIDYAIERKRLEKDLFQRANCDCLTGLPNRDMFINRLDIAMARAARHHTHIAVLFIDLDRFKFINDTYGHDAGDSALKAVSRRIKSVLRVYDTAARLGGDEFAVLLEGIKTPRDAANIAQKLVIALHAPLPYKAHSLDISASIGVALSNELENSDAFLRNADTAMYYAKKEGGNAYRFYMETMQDEVQQKLSLEEDLRKAIRAGKLQLYYQPFMSMDQQELLGIEALIRWPHPKHGLISADEFLPVAEEAHLMLDIATWICTQLHRDVALWTQQSLPPITLTLNLSISQLEAPDIMEWLEKIAQEGKLASHKLAIELPEEAVASISGGRFLRIAKLHEMGIELHLDHFGRNMLPLTALCSLPFSLLKIDRSLIENMTRDNSNNILISAAIMLAHHLEVKVGAVGVEEPWQLNVLRTQKCDAVQGFLIARPMPADAIAQWIESRAAGCAA